MKNNILLLLHLLVTTVSQAQQLLVLPKKENLKPPKQNLQKKENNTFYFFDDFSNNKNKWILKPSKDSNKANTDPTLGKIQIINGKLQITTNEEQSFCYKNFNVNASENFSCSVEIKFIENDGLDFLGCGLAFCSDLTYREPIGFCVNPSNNFYKIIGGSNDIMQALRKTNFEEESEPESKTYIIKIISTQNGPKFYINGLEVVPKSEIALPIGLDGNDYGLIIPANTTVEFDNFELKGTKRKK